jgi:uncharacterized protein
MGVVELAGEKYVSLTTFKRDGGSSAKPVWIAGLGDGRLGFTTDTSSLKVRRIRHDGRVRLQPCDMRGNVRAGSSPIDATAIVVDERDADGVRVRDAIAAKYGWQYRLITMVGRVQARFGRDAHAGGSAIVITDRA